MKVLYIVDPQNDFLDDGNLPVKGAKDQMFELASYLSKILVNTYDKIIVSLDWHPANHCSFLNYDGEWPEHCIEYTEGALPYRILMNVLKNVYMPLNKVQFILKGRAIMVDEYSGVTEANLPIIKNIIKDDTIVDICGIVGTVCVQNTIEGLIKDAQINPKNINVLLDYTAQFNEESKKNFIEWCNKNSVNY